MADRPPVNPPVVRRGRGNFKAPTTLQSVQGRDQPATPDVEKIATKTSIGKENKPHGGNVDDENGVLECINGTGDAIDMDLIHDLFDRFASMRGGIAIKRFGTNSAIVRFGHVSTAKRALAEIRHGDLTIQVFTGPTSDYEELQPARRRADQRGPPTSNGVAQRLIHGSLGWKSPAAMARAKKTPVDAQDTRQQPSKGIENASSPSTRPSRASPPPQARRPSPPPTHRSAPSVSQDHSKPPSRRNDASPSWTPPSRRENRPPQGRWEPPARRGDASSPSSPSWTQDRRLPGSSPRPPRDGGASSAWSSMREPPARQQTPERGSSPRQTMQNAPIRDQSPESPAVHVKLPPRATAAASPFNAAHASSDKQSTHEAPKSSKEQKGTTNRANTASTTPSPHESPSRSPLSSRAPNIPSSNASNGHFSKDEKP
ncbi:hypothetical protein BC940DRAFT_317531 [Gongronella butleri]|nr:hypothetical protein BC940DRAFT_317531 [Gongronella butleri]